MKIVNHKFFICCLSLWEKDFYLSVNIIDIVMACVFIFNVIYNKGYRYYHFSTIFELIVNIAYGVYAIVVLVFYFMKKSFSTKIHSTYMVIR